MQTHSDDLHYSRTSVYSLQYHLIIVTKYRRDVLIGSVKQELEALLRSLADQFDMQIEEMEIMSDHVHMLVDASPKHSISSIMKGLKGVSARMLFMHHPEIKQKLWGGHLWQPSYFAVTVSERSEEQIRHYIQHQKPSKGKTR
ncbi:IS200/IS605 family transposase [Limosilactobacillus mucosae]|uniref:IS200/IS605 family transposase n=1 Tax=Limosilactobacillus mucosae TaxID=97478 RepID=UPI0023AFE84D|nr:IS200/IS605 family transposase [Limosilactobacillus mucosae]MDE8678107.1 IS200/IS605 family transposase [Limosilactobacillus mucosae]